MAQWWRRIFSNASTHLYPLTLEPRLLTNWTARGFKLHPGIQGAPADWAYTDTKTGSLSLGHAGFTDETWEVLHLPGLKLSFRAREIDEYLSLLERLGVRTELGRPYYKLHGAGHCLCLLPRHRDELLVKLESRLAKANAIAAAEALVFNERLDKMSEHPNLKIDQRLPEKKGMGRA
jgi:hypothetical protein